MLYILASLGSLAVTLSIQVGIIEEFVTDAVDLALDSKDVEEETEEVDKVLTEIVG